MTDRRARILLATTMLAWWPCAHAADAPAKTTPAKTALAKTAPPAAQTPAPDPAGIFASPAVNTDGSVDIGGKRIDYTATAGTLVVHPAGYDDVKQDRSADDKDKPQNEAAMFYVAYTRKNTRPESRPITFLFNGGPGSSTVWLHMGAFGPRRVVTADDSHTAAAPYQLVDNAQSLLDVSDLVFIDAPGTGFGRISGRDDKNKQFHGIDQDAHAFGEFIETFLGRFGRWNSPKYLFGESYGTTRAAVLSYMLQNDFSIDLNGVVLLSQILNFDASLDGPDRNPGVDLGYEVALPSYTAVAWYHHKLPPDANPPANESGLPALLARVQQWAVTDYAAALAAGASLDPARRAAIAQQLHLYTGLPLAYIQKANLRITGGEFEKTLQDDTDTTTGRLDARFSGPTMDPLSKEADYDPQSTAISSAYVSTFNDYVRRTLHFGDGQTYKPFLGNTDWDFTHHHQPDSEGEGESIPNVMPDLAAAMKANPLLRVQLDQGYYDLATPYFEGIYEMQHLPMPARLQANIEYKQYASGHMVYAHQASLQQLHDNVASFITRTANQPASTPAREHNAPP